MLTRRPEIAPNMDVSPPRRCGARIKRKNLAELFVDEHIGTGRERFEVEALVFDKLFHGFGFCVVGEKRYAAIAIRKEINGVAEPNRVIVIGILARDFFEL